MYCPIWNTFESKKVLLIIPPVWKLKPGQAWAPDCEGWCVKGAPPIPTTLLPASAHMVQFPELAGGSCATPGRVRFSISYWFWHRILHLYQDLELGGVGKGKILQRRDNYVLFVDNKNIPTFQSSFRRYQWNFKKRKSLEFWQDDPPLAQFLVFVEWWSSDLFVVVDDDDNDDDDDDTDFSLRQQLSS